MATKTTDTKQRRKPLPDEVKKMFAQWGQEGAKFGPEGAKYGKEGAKYGAEGGQISANLIEMGKKYAEENDIDPIEWENEVKKHHGSH